MRLRNEQAFVIRLPNARLVVTNPVQERMRCFGSPIASKCQTQPFPAWQTKRPPSASSAIPSAAAATGEVKKYSYLGGTTIIE